MRDPKFRMAPNDVRFEIAGPDALEQAVRLQQYVYARDLGHVPKDETELSARHFVAITSRKVVACFRLLGPETRPFDLEASIDLGSLLGSEARPALVGRLCIHPAYRKVRQSLLISAGLMKLVLQYAAQNRITDLLLYTYPELQNLYRVAGFRDANVVFHHKDWGDIRLMRRSLVHPDHGPLV